MTKAEFDEMEDLREICRNVGRHLLGYPLHKRMHNLYSDHCKISSQDQIFTGTAAPWNLNES